MIYSKKNLLTVLFIIVIVMVSSYFLGVRSDKEMIHIASAQDQVRKDLAAVKEKQSDSEKWIASKDVDLGYLENGNEDVLAKYREKKGTIEYLFATVLMGDPELFAGAFMPQVISSDFFKVDNPDKFEVARTIMDEISRSGKLTEISYKTKKGLLQQESNKVLVTLYYKDGHKVKTEIELIQSKDHHDEEYIYSVNSSSWKIVDDIRKSENK